ncbi:MAG: FAD-dependent oxidoreductase [Pseudomonadota bacterium]
MTTDSSVRHTRVCIIGGGAMGVGLLYHLALEGWTDCLLVEKGELTSGSTWHAAGQCPHFVPSLSLAHVHHYGTQLYPKLVDITGQSASWHGCGGIRLALTDTDVEMFYRAQGIARMVGYDFEIVGPNDIKPYHPYLNVDDVKVGALTRDDGHVDPASMTNAMAKGARDLGARIEARNRVLDVKHRPDGEWDVHTEKGVIRCEHVVNAAGSYSDIVGGWSGVQVPITNVLHHYVVTEPVPELDNLGFELPVVRDPYSSCYLRQEQRSILVGIYETAGSVTCLDDISWDFESELLPPEMERLEPWLERALERLPLFGEYGIRRTVPGAITHTPDGTYLSGPGVGPANYWLHCGASIGICQGAGAGKYLAQWMVHGDAEINMAEFDPRRFADWAAGDYCRTMALCDYEHMYALWPHGDQHAAGRPQRTSALYETLKARGGLHETILGWERARWFDRAGDGERHSWRNTNWFDAVGEECRAVREGAGIIDLSAFAKFEVSGPGAEDFLARVLANGVPRKGAVRLTHLLSERGRIEAEFTCTRTEDETFYLLSGAAAETKDFDLLCKAAVRGDALAVRNVTDDVGVLAITGPRSRDLLSQLTNQSLSNDVFPWLSAQRLDVAGVDCLALRVSYVGELGWELHMPRDAMPEVYDALMNVGAEAGLRDFGTYAMNSLRLEKGYRAMGSELTNEVTLVEADMLRFARFDKAFVGRESTETVRESGPSTRLVYMEVDATKAHAFGNEPVYQGDDVVGVSTSGGYGYAVQKSLAFAYVNPSLATPGQRLEIELQGERRPATVLDDALWDPSNERMRA